MLVPPHCVFWWGASGLCVLACRHTRVVCLWCVPAALRAVWCPAGGRLLLVCVVLLCMSAAGFRFVDGSWCGGVLCQGAAEVQHGASLVGDVESVSCGRSRRRRNMMGHDRHVMQGAATDLKVGHVRTHSQPTRRVPAAGAHKS